MKPLFPALCVLAASCAFAAPNPAYVPAAADLVIVIDHINERSPAQDKAIQNLKAAGLYETTILNHLDEIHTLMPVLAKSLLGYTDNGAPMATHSITVAACLPEIAVDENGLPSSIGLYAVIENPEMDLTTFTKTLQQLSEEGHFSEPYIESPDGWVIFEQFETAKGETFFGYRPIPEGVLVVSTKDYDPTIRSDLTEGTLRSIKDINSPLLKAFFPPVNTEGAQCSIAIWSIKDLVARYCANTDLPQYFPKINPDFVRLSSATIQMFAKGDTSYLTVEVVTDEKPQRKPNTNLRNKLVNRFLDSPMAGKILDAPLTWLASVLVNLLPPTETSLRDVLTNAKTSANGAIVNLTVSIPLETGLQLLRYLGSAPLGKLMNPDSDTPESTEAATSAALP